MKTRDLPMVALRAFSVVAETGSVTRAADVLGVTHSAVSKHLRSLEDWLGQALFVREGRLLILSPFGSLLARKVGPAIREMAEACDQVHRHRGRKIITVEAPATFAMYWLMPRLAAYRALEPRVDVWVSTRMTGQQPDLARHDMIILRGHQSPPSLVSRTPHLLLTEAMTVVAAKGWADSACLTKPSDVTKYPLIGSVTRPDDWVRWMALAKLRVEVPGGGHRFDHLFVAMQAVRDGFGTIVAPRNIFGLHLSREELVCPFPDLCFEGSPYIAYFVSDESEGYRRRFLRWLLDEACRN